MIETVDRLIESAASWIWNVPLVALVTGGGLYFLVRCGSLPWRHIGRALEVLSGRHGVASGPGQVSHFKALCIALAKTIGMGNIAGVAIAIEMGGPGAIFWMWVSALVGMATNYVTCTLAIMYRGRDSAGELQGGPMYVIVEGMGQRWRPLAVFFCAAGVCGTLPVFNANQLTLATCILIGVTPDSPNYLNAQWIIGIGMAGLTAMIIFGGLKRIAKVVSYLVPAMIVVYFFSVAGILLKNAGDVPRYLGMIVSDAFRADYVNHEAMFGGILGALIVLGVRRAAFSNEAGIGTAPLAYGAAKTSEPVEEGLVAMVGPAIDTLLVCTLTALAILISGAWIDGDHSGVGMTSAAFRGTYSIYGEVILFICLLFFGLSTLFSSAYYGAKCFAFVFGAHTTAIHSAIYIVAVVLGSTMSMSIIVNFADLTMALMSIPTMIAAIILTPRVVSATKQYFARLHDKQGVHR